MKKALFGVTALALGLMAAPTAEADTFYFNFCGFSGDSATCPSGVTEASLTFEEVDALDDNAYTLTIKITGDATSADYIDAVQFKYDAAQTPDGYEQKPTLGATPAGDTWTAFWGNLPSQCGPADTFTGNAVCAASTGLGVSPIGTNTWVFNVDFAAGIAPITLNSAVNLRAAMPFCHETGGPNPKLICEGGNLSPEGHYESDTTGPVDTSGPVDTIGTPTGPVPEPALLSLLGLGLIGAATRLRKKD